MLVENTCITQLQAISCHIPANKSTTKIMEISNLRMPKKDVKAAYVNPVAQGLYQTIANLAQITALGQLIHWNMVGPCFFSLHPVLGEQYNAAFDLEDEIAERIRALGLQVYSTDPAMLKMLANMPEVTVPIDPTDCSANVGALLAMHQKSIADLKALVRISGEAGDLTTQNMVLGWIEAEEKTVWMLRSYLGIA